MIRKSLLAIVAALALPLFGSAVAAPDSNADADGGFHNTVAQSHAVMIKVPVNQKGEENTNAAEMRLITSGGKTQPANFETAWASGLDVSKQQPTTGAAGDTSTHGHWWGWNNWYGYGWSYNYYYTYQPYYYYYTNYYYYSTPYYYNYYYGYGYPYYGYRYYYYPACW